MKLRVWINGYTFPVVQGATFKDNFNEELDSGTIIIEKYVSNITQGVDFPAANDTEGSTSNRFNEYLEINQDVRNNLKLVPKMDVIIYDYEATGHREGWHRGKNGSSDTSTRYTPNYFYKHFVIENFTENEVFLGDYGDRAYINGNDELIGQERDFKQYKKTYKYTIFLCSEIKKTERLPLPNLKITQPLYLFKDNYSSVNNLQLDKNSVWFYLNQYVESYNATERIGDTIRGKYVLDKSVKDIFDKIICPEMTITGRTLREALSSLMVVKDRIPYIKDDVIYALDISNPSGVFDNYLGQVNYRNAQMSGEDYIFGLRRNHSQSIAQDYSTHSVEYLGFRNSSTPYLKLDNLTLETTFPIYRINRMYMCYYKPTTDGNFYYCKQDITKLVKLGSERMALSQDWEQFEDDYPLNIDELSQYKLATVEYNIGSNKITGWGEKYTYPRGWWAGQGTATYLENIIIFLDNRYPKGSNYFADNNENNPNDINVLPAIKKVSGGLSELATALDNIFSDGIGLFLKKVTFIIDYVPFYSGTTVVTKGIGDIDDNLMSFDSVGPLTVLEKDGINCKEKLERFGNKNYTYSYRYVSSFDGSVTAYSQLQPVGSVDNVINPGVILYSREYSIFDNLINATYTGAEEYILKNYYTNVAAKYRTWSLMSFDESVKRNENFYRTILISKDKNISDSNDYKLTTPSTLNDFVFNLFSFYKQSEVPDSTISYKERIMWNAGYFECDYFYYTFSGKNSTKHKGIGGKFLSDFNTFVTGTSLCMNISMTDNITGGTYIEKINPASEVNGLTDVDKEVIGARQAQYYLADSTNNGKIENIKFGFIHYDYNDLLYTSDGKVNSSEMDSNLEKLYKLPLLPDNVNVSNNLEVNYTVNKDNGEYLDFTMQYDFMADKDIIVSPYVAKLSDSITGFYKQKDALRTITYSSSYDTGPSGYQYPFAIFCTSLRATTEEASFPDDMSYKFALVNSTTNTTYNHKTRFKAPTSYEMFFPYITIAIRNDFSSLGTEFDLSGKQAEIIYKNAPSGNRGSDKNVIVSDNNFYHIEELKIIFTKIDASSRNDSVSLGSKTFSIPCILVKANMYIKYKRGTSDYFGELQLNDIEMKLYEIREDNQSASSPAMANNSSDWNGRTDNRGNPTNENFTLIDGAKELSELKKEFSNTINSHSEGYYDFRDFKFYRVMLTEILTNKYDDDSGYYSSWVNFYPQSMNLVLSKECMYDTMRVAKFNANSNNINLTNDEAFYSVSHNYSGANLPNGWRNVKILSTDDISGDVSIGSLSNNSFNIPYSNTSSNNYTRLIAPIFVDNSSDDYYYNNPITLSDVGDVKFNFSDIYFNSSRQSMGIKPTTGIYVNGQLQPVSMIDKATTSYTTDDDDNGYEVKLYLNGMWRMQCGELLVGGNHDRLSHSIDYWDNLKAIQVPFLIYNDDFDQQTNAKLTVLNQNLYYVNINRPLLKEDIYKELTQEEFELLIGHSLGEHYNYDSGITITENGNTFSFNQSGNIAVFYRVDSNCGKVDDIGRITYGNYILVFAVNNYTANTPVYLSYLSKRDTRIFDENHKVVRHLGD